MTSLVHVRCVAGYTPIGVVHLRRPENKQCYSKEIILMRRVYVVAKAVCADKQLHLWTVCLTTNMLQWHVSGTS